MLYLLVFLVGLAVGSFVNVVIYRLPRGITFITGRSKCPACDHDIPWHDLIPVVSFFILNSRCRRCKSKISWSYPLIEIYSGLIFLLSFWLFGQYPPYWLFSLALLELFLILAMIDLRYLILPDSVIFAMLTLTLGYGIVERFFFGNPAFIIFSIDNLIAAFLAFSLFFLIWFFSGGAWMGLGDAKLAGIVGLVFGISGAAIVLYISIIAGALAGLILLTLKRAKLNTKLPLGLFIGFSSSLYILFGPVIIEKSKEALRFVFPLF